MLFKPTKLALLISGFSALSPLMLAASPLSDEVAATEVVKTEKKEQGLQLPHSTVNAVADKDADGRDKVYQDNVTNLYIGREELERFQTTNPGDVFKGMNGVYSMDSRNGSAITPNIRGLSGEGRVPLTVDGTEQSTNVWLQVYGAGNRNYVDPAMFRSISVEKGPSLSRDVRSGVGGSVNVRTIEAADIIPEGDSFGIEFTTESSGNSIKPQVDANSYFGQDYRSIPGATLGADNNVNIPQPVPRTKGHNDQFNFDDHAEMFAIAARNDVTDLLLSYSQREKGNYFAGNHGAGEYSRNDAYARDTSAYYPNLTRLYHPGNEVLSTSSNSETTLVKNNWYLPNDHKLGWSFMRSDLEFAETSPGQAVAMLGIAEELAKQGRYDQLVAEFPRSELRLDTYKLSHEWKPEGSPWIDLQSSLWMTKTDGVRHQTGGGAYYINDSSALKAYNTLKGDWDACRGPNWASGLPSGAMGFTCFTNPALNPNMGGTAPVQPDHDGRIFAGSSQWTNHDRTGFDISNLMLLSDTLRLTVGGAFQHEKLDERVADVNLTGGIGVGGANFHYSTANYGPRSGDRDEYSGMFNFEWQPMPWLTLTAGTRYHRYSAYDEGLAQRRRQKVASAEAVKRKVGVELQYGELMSDREESTYQQLFSSSVEAAGRLTPEDFLAMHNGITTPNLAASTAAQDALNQWRNGRDMFRDGATGAYYWKQTVVVPVVDGKVQSSQSPLADDPINSGATVTNPQGLTGEIAVKQRDTGSTGLQGKAIYADIAADQAWAEPEKQSGEAWSPVFSATARVTEHGTVFLRYAQTTRFPSIFEIASTSVGMDGVGALSVDGASKPERSTNWEVGYGHDLTQFFPGLQMADARLSYFNTEIKDFIERDSSLAIIQFDRKETSGIEFQSRFDSGRYYGSLGATYRLDQKLCDKDYAYGLDVYHNRMPECMTGGFADTLTATSLQPKYSINAELGTRLFNDRVELGWRGVYHAKAENDDLDDLLSSSYGKDIWQQNSMSQMYWHSVLLHDVYARVEVQENLDVSLGLTNLTDRYYMDPMSKIPVPGPGRTLTAGLRLRF
ncbi:TonB-dependent receptor domain-containing protein [Pseudomonas huaxiensis]|uniref:TonB-dependent receptor domain-containing protein n=1 Tax=Pseudomonas huaxiensis TaxID=2213017 RepID=UPI000DA6C1ED|nr:TonB-dependent receptor [Pseudomonas huaxiensis]